MGGSEEEHTGFRQVRIEILDEAQDDLIDGFRFYDSQSVGLGHHFLGSLFADIDSLEGHVGIHPVHWGYHRFLAKRFPYAVYYRVTGNVICVSAVLDCRRNPSWIRERLS